MNKGNLISSVAEKTGMSKKDSEKVVDAVMACIEEALAKDEKIQLLGFGTFEVRDRAERTGRNPQTGAEITIPAAKVPVFKAGRTLKEAIQG